MTLFSWGLLPPTVVFDEYSTTPSVLPSPIVKPTVIRRGRGLACIRVDGIVEVIADEVALDQGADNRLTRGVKGGDRHADAEVDDDQPTQQRVRGVEHKPGRPTRLEAGCRR